MKKTTILLALALAQAAHAWEAPNYRVFRGYRRADVSQETFMAKLAADFIPAAPATHQKNGLIAYVPAVLPSTATPGSPDEIAIVIYESEAVYNAARNSPEGKAYSDLHWTLFEEPASGRTRSGSAKPFARDLVLDQPVDVFHKYVDWQQGHTAVFAGSRRPTHTPAQFAKEVSEHVAKVRDTFGPMGLDGYIVVLHAEAPHDLTQEIAWMHWTSANAMKKAFETPAGQAIRAESEKLFQRDMWAEAPAFEGTIEAGQAVNVKFAPRPRP
jgi:quinol monooxygenase YgiN